MNESAVVTGGAGFIGSHLCRSLLEDGWKVTVIDNLSTGKEENLADLLAESRFEWRRGDIRRPEAWEDALTPGGVVFHLAAMTSVRQSVEAPLECHAVNATGTLAVLEAARRRGIARAVLASTTAVYGDAGRRRVGEGTQPRPISPYAASKLAAEHYAQVFSRLYGLPSTPLRYFNVYGPRQDPRSEYAAVIPRFIERMTAGLPPIIYGDGLQTRDFVFVADVVRANRLAAEAHSTGGRAYNIASGKTHSLLDIVAALNQILRTELTPVHQKAQPGDIRHSAAAIRAAREALGFLPDTTLRQGLEATIASFAAP